VKYTEDSKVKLQGFERGKSHHCHCLWYKETNLGSWTYKRWVFLFLPVCLTTRFLKLYLLALTGNTI